MSSELAVRSETLSLALASTSTLSTTKPWQFLVDNYGAVGDDATDDTAAINAAMAAAVTYAEANNYNAEVIFSAKTYVASSATTKGGAGQGNAQIPLPSVSTTGKKLVLVLRGTPFAEAFAHWQQTVGQRAGAVIRSTLTGQTTDGTWGAPSVIGGPTAGTYSGGGLFSNLRIIIDGLIVMAPYNPTVIAFDLSKCAQASILSAGALADAGPAGTPSLYTIPTSGNGMGLRMPFDQNNAVSDIVEFSCEGFFYGVVVGEHLSALRILCVGVDTGIYVIVGPSAIQHGFSINYLAVEIANTALFCEPTGGSMACHIGQLDVEQINTRDVDDANNCLLGVVYHNVWPARTPTVQGAGNLKVLSVTSSATLGARTAPTVPTSTTALVNPFWRDCAVTVTGGTVTAIAVDNTATGLTAGTVIVPSGKTIKLTYSAAPTWVWIAL